MKTNSKSSHKQLLQQQANPTAERRAAIAKLNVQLVRLRQQPVTSYYGDDQQLAAMTKQLAAF